MLEPLNVIGVVVEVAICHVLCLKTVSKTRAELVSSARLNDFKVLLEQLQERLRS